MTDEIKRISQFREPSKELDRLKLYSRKLNKDPRSYISEEKEKHYIKLGKEKQEEIKSSCSLVNNRKPPLVDAVRDQDGIGWCYAYAAAD